MTGDRDVETAVRPRGRRVAHLLALVACAVVVAPALAGAATLARVADVAYGPLAAVGVSAHGATISGRDLRVRIRLRRRAGIRLSVVAGDEIRGYAKRSLAPGSYLFHGRLDRAPQGSGLMLRITARLADGRRGRERFKLTVLAANHAPTALALSNAAVAENQPAGTSVGAFSATDADRLDVPAFALVSGPGGQDNAAFRITGATLRTAASFDFETRSSYSIRVRVTDGHGGSFERTFTIGVTNVNEPPVGLALTGGRVAENQPAGTTVGTLTATDPDAGDTVAFALVGGPGSADNAAFTISGATLRTAGSFDFETKSSYTVRVVASDGRGGSTEQAFVIAVTNVDEAPLVVASAGSTAYLENDPATVIDPGVSVTDVDSPTLASATVAVTAGLQPGADSLAFTAAAPISGAYAPATGVLTLTGAASPAAYEAALRSVRFLSTSDAPGTSRTVSFTVGDGTLDSSPATRAIAVTPVNDPPAVTTSSGPVTYTEAGPATPIDPGLVLADPDSLIAGATVQITGHHTGPEDVLALPAQPSITGAYDSTSGTLTLSGTDTVVAYQAALRAVTYEDTSANPSTAPRTVTVLATDDAASSSAPATRGIAITATDTPPAVSTGPGALAYTENDPPAAIDPAVTVSDPDSVDLTGATVQITGGYATGQDVLALPAQPLVTGSFDPAAGVLTLSGSAPVAAYQAALAAVTYANTSENPSPAPRTVSFAARDATGFGSPATRGVTVAPVDDPPVAVADAATVTEDAGPSPIDVLANDTDVDGGPKAVGAASQPAHGTVVVTGGGTGLTYAPDANYCGADTFLYKLNGGSMATVSVTVSCVDDPPVAVDDAATVTEDAGPSPIDVLANDTDIDGGPKTVAAVSTPAHGTVLVTGGGTGLTYAPDANYCGADSFLYTLNGGSTATVSVTVTCVDDPPVAVDDAATVIEDSGASPIDVLTNDTDVDGGPRSIQAVTQPADGAVAITGAGTGLTYTPSPNYCNNPPGTTPDTFTYALNGGSTASVAVTVTCVNDDPVAANDTIPVSAVGNTALVVNVPGHAPPAVNGPHRSVAADILANDTDVDGPGPLAVVAGTFTTHDGGTVVMQTDGGFVYTPKPGCADASDFFPYTVTDGYPGAPGTAVGRVDLTLSGCVWYVDNNAAGNAGTSTAPFGTLAQAQAASGAGDTIFVADGDGTSSGYGAGIALKANQQLIGEAADLKVGGATLQAGDPARRPTIAANNADVVTLASGDTVRGLRIDPAGTGGGIAGAAGVAGGTIDDVRITDTGTAGTQPDLGLSGTTGTFAVTGLQIDNTAAGSPATGVLLTNAGTVDFGSTSISTVTGRGLDATGTNMSSSSFDSISVAAATNGAIRMLNTTGATTFGDGAGTDLALTTSSGAAPAFQLDNAGSVTVPAGGTANVSATGGPAIDVTNTPGPSLAFDAVSSSASTGDAVNLDGLATGTFSAGAGTLAGFAGTAFDLNGGSGAVSYAGAINNGAGQTADITGRTGGAVSLSGSIADSNDAGGGITLANDTGGSTTFSGASKVIDTSGGGDAVTMSASDGHTLSFTGGGLAITAAAGKGLEATGSGTLVVSGAGNTIDTTTGRALDIASTDIGAGGVTFQRISANGAANGIVLDTTGASGSLVVTGNGAGTCIATDTSGCSGGQIRNTSGADNAGATPSGTGVVLNHTLTPSLTRMWIHDNSNYAIRGTSVSGFTLDHSVINGSNGDNGTTPFDDSSVWFDNLTGSASVTNTYVGGGYEDNFRVVNTSGSLNRITFTSDTVGDNSAAGGNDGVLLESSTTAGQLEATVQSSTFTGAGGDLLQFDHNGSGAGDLVLTGNSFSNNHPGIATGGGGLTLTNGGTSGATTMSITGANTFRDAVGNALTIAKATGPSTQTGTFSGNTIGVNGVANSGSAEGDALKLQTLGQGSTTWTVTNNTIRGYNDFGVELLAGGSASAQGGAVNATITGNTIDQPGSTAGTLSLPKNGVHLNIGTVPGDTYQACAVIGGPGGLANSLASAGKPGDDGLGNLSGGEDVRLRQRQSTTIRLPGYGGAPTDGAAVQAFVAANNPSGGPTVATSINSPPGGGFTGAGTTCP